MPADIATMPWRSSAPAKGLMPRRCAADRADATAAGCSGANHTFINNLIDAGEPLREPFILPSKPEPDSDEVSVVHHHDMQKE